ncbi:MAG: hypothetical protein LN413_05620 [Candidatus Thermoplasmatota archaeon]|nr:hypothetical protein [Candidatus Thermoplasmatota archaeon]
MPTASPLFELQPTSQKEADEWILVLIGALRKKSGKGEWSLRIVHDDGQELVFECDPPLSNEDVSEVFVRYHIRSMTANEEDLREGE